MSRLHNFRGQHLSVRQISVITGISRWTLQRRVSRGIALDAPVRGRRLKKRIVKPHLTGDWHRDVEMIVRWMHQRFANSREARALRKTQ